MTYNVLIFDNANKYISVDVKKSLSLKKCNAHFPVMSGPPLHTEYQFMLSTSNDKQQNRGIKKVMFDVVNEWVNECINMLGYQSQSVSVRKNIKP